jgi:hypothetical protein
MNDLENLLIEFEHTLKENNAESLKAFQSGLTNDEISYWLSKIEVLSDEKLHTLYSWHNGIKYDSGWTVGEFNFFSLGVMLSLEDVIHHANILKESISIESKLLLPLFASGNGDYVLYQADIKSNDFGILFLHAPMLTLSERPVSIYDSLEALLKTVIESYKQGAYRIGGDGQLSVDYELEQQVSRTINKDADFWN